MSDNSIPPTDQGKPNPPPSSDATSGAVPLGFHNLPRRQVFITLAGVLMAMFLSSLDQTVVGTAMPQIIADLKGFEHYTWVATAYLLTATIMMPIVGRLTDMYGRKWFYIIGIVIFLVGSALCGISQNMTQLILFRGFQGVGAGIMMANAFIVIGDLFPPSERGKYQGLIVAVFGLSSIIGPLLGGFITDNISWHWIFYINLPLGVPVVLAFIRFFPDVRPLEKKHKLDYLGMAALVLCISPLIIGLSWAGSDYEWVSPQVIGALSVSAVMLIAFILVESRAAEPVMPLALFSSRTVVVAAIVRFCIGMGMFGVILFVPLFFQAVLGRSATYSGTLLMPQMLAMVVASTLSGQAVARLGGHYRIQAIIGLAIMAAGMFLLSFMDSGTSHAQAILAIVVTGIGMGIAMPLFVIAVQNDVPYRVMGVATSSTQFFQSIGQAVGLAVFGSMVASRFTANVMGNEAITQLGLPPELVTQMTSNPEALMSEQARVILESTVGSDLAGRFLVLVKDDLSVAITSVFAIGAFVIVVAFVTTWFLKQHPLKRSHVPASPE
jgi:EmrB/QacA subfamily drug resistance transporter